MKMNLLAIATQPVRFGQVPRLHTRLTCEDGEQNRVCIAPDIQNCRRRRRRPRLSIDRNKIRDRRRQFISDFPSLSIDQLSTLPLLHLHDKLAMIGTLIYTTADPIHVYSCTYVSREANTQRKRAGEREATI